MNPPPSPDDEPGVRRGDELLVAARRRLPREVAVVELAGSAAEPVPGRDGPRLPRVAGGLLAGAVALSGCSPSAADVRADAAGSKSQTLAVSRDVLGRLTEVGTFPRPPRGGWSGCDDFGGKVLYHVTARLDPAEGQPGALVDAVRTRLGEAGLRLRARGSEDDDPLTLEAMRDDVRVQVTGYPTRPMVLFDVSGSCQDVGDLDEELLGEAPERVDLG